MAYSRGKELLKKPKSPAQPTVEKAEETGKTSDLILNALYPILDEREKQAIHSASLIIKSLEPLIKAREKEQMQIDAVQKSMDVLAGELHLLSAEIRALIDSKNENLMLEKTTLQRVLSYLS